MKSLFTGKGPSWNENNIEPLIRVAFNQLTYFLHVLNGGRSEKDDILYIKFDFSLERVNFADQELVFGEGESDEVHECGIDAKDSVVLGFYFLSTKNYEIYYQNLC